MVLSLIFPEIPRVLGAYEKSKKRGSFHKGTFTYYVSTRGGEGGSTLLTAAYRGGGRG